MNLGFQMYTYFLCRNLIFLLLAMLFFCDGPRVNAQALNSQYFQIKIDHGVSNQPPTLDVFLNGQGPYKFYVDTASTQTLISKSLADKLKLNPELEKIKSSNMTVGGVEESLFSKAIKISLSPKQHSVELTPIIKNDDNLVHPNIDGVIGLTFLMGSKIANIPSEKALFLEFQVGPHGCNEVWINRCYSKTNSPPSILSHVAGKKVPLLIDTGFTGLKEFLLLKSDLTNHIWAKTNSQNGSLLNESLSDKKLRRILTEDFTFADNDNCQANFYIFAPNDRTPKQNSEVGLLGWSALKEMKFLIDFTGKTPKVSVPKDYCPYKAINTSGLARLGFNKQTKRAIILRINSNSPAANAGLKVGDEIQSVKMRSNQEVSDFSISSNLRQIVYLIPGETATFEVLRLGKQLNVEVKAEEVFFAEIR